MGVQNITNKYLLDKGEDGRFKVVGSSEVADTVEVLGKLFNRVGLGKLIEVLEKTAEEWDHVPPPASGQRWVLQEGKTGDFGVCHITAVDKSYNVIVIEKPDGTLCKLELGAFLTRWTVSPYNEV